MNSSRLAVAVNPFYAVTEWSFLSLDWAHIKDRIEAVIYARRVARFADPVATAAKLLPASEVFDESVIGPDPDPALAPALYQSSTKVDDHETDMEMDSDDEEKVKAAAAVAEETEKPVGPAEGVPDEEQNGGDVASANAEEDEEADEGEDAESESEGPDVDDMEWVKHKADGMGEGGSGSGKPSAPATRPPVLNYSKVSGTGLKGRGVKFSDMPNWGSVLTSTPTGTVRTAPARPASKSDLKHFQKRGRGWVWVGTHMPVPDDWNYDARIRALIVPEKPAAEEKEEVPPVSKPAPRLMHEVPKPTIPLNSQFVTPNSSLPNMKLAPAQFFGYPYPPTYPYPTSWAFQNPTIYSVTSVQYNPEALRALPNESWAGWGRGPRAVNGSSPAPSDTPQGESSTVISQTASPLPPPPSQLDQPPPPPADDPPPRPPSQRRYYIEIDEPIVARPGPDENLLQREIRGLPGRVRRATPRSSNMAASDSNGSVTPASRSSPPPSNSSNSNFPASSSGHSSSGSAAPGIGGPGTGGGHGGTEEHRAPPSSGGGNNNGGEGGGSGSAGSAERQCENCKVTVSPNWRTGPNNQMFCNVSTRLYGVLHFGRLVDSVF